MTDGRLNMLTPGTFRLAARRAMRHAVAAADTPKQSGWFDNAAVVVIVIVHPLRRIEQIQTSRRPRSR